MGDLCITSSNGKVYKNIRAYHIALGHAVRQALFKFLDDIENFCQEKVNSFYEEYEPQDYSRTYQLLGNMNVGGLIKAKIQGNWQGNGIFEIDPFDWGVLEARFNGYGKFNTYMDFDGDDSTSDIEGIFARGINGHDNFEIRQEVQKYIDDNLDDVIQKVLKSM